VIGLLWLACTGGTPAAGASAEAARAAVRDGLGISAPLDVAAAPAGIEEIRDRLWVVSRRIVKHPVAWERWWVVEEAIVLTADSGPAEVRALWKALGTTTAPPERRATIAAVALHLGPSHTDWDLDFAATPTGVADFVRGVETTEIDGGGREVTVRIRSRTPLPHGPKEQRFAERSYRSRFDAGGRLMSWTSQHMGPAPE
jgi:hypothetical protein